jgi:chorismate synthase
MLVGILDGMVAGVPLDLEAANAQMRRRMAGYGRGKRMKIEADEIRIVGGVRHGETLGGPIAWLIENRDWVNWQQVMAIEAPGSIDAGGDVAESGNRVSAVSDRRVTRPRPGHADLVGGLKYDRGDLRDILERASARETASRVAAGAICRQFLAQLGIRIGSHVTRIGDAVVPEDIDVPFEQLGEVDESPVRCADPVTGAAMVSEIDDAIARLDTLGGSFEVIASGVPVGLGSHTQWDRRLEARIAQAMLSIQAQKGVEIGPAIHSSSGPGSQAHDAILPRDEDGDFVRPTNRCGGTEGGITTGQELRVTVYMKPLSTLRQPLPSVDIETGDPEDAVVQRSDTCAVPAASIIGEAMLALVLADACLEKFGGDSLGETRRNLDGYLAQTRRFPPAR